MKKIMIDNSVFMELIDELTADVTKIYYGTKTYKSNDSVNQKNILTFTNKAQNFYNKKYDEYETLFNNLGNIYPQK